MVADLNNAEYYKGMLDWAMENGLVVLVEHSNGSYGLKHNGAIEASQLEAAYFGLLAKAGLLKDESTLILPAGEVAVDKEVIKAINKPNEPVVHPKPSVLATPATREPSAAAGTPDAKKPRFIFPERGPKT